MCRAKGDNSGTSKAPCTHECRLPANDIWLAAGMLPCRGPSHIGLTEAIGEVAVGGSCRAAHAG